MQQKQQKGFTKPSKTVVGPLLKTAIFGSSGCKEPGKERETLWTLSLCSVYLVARQARLAPQWM